MRKIRLFIILFVSVLGDPCIISTQNELETAIRLFEINKEPEITIHGKSSYRNAIDFLVPVGLSFVIEF